MMNDTFSENCYITTDCDMKGNSVYITGSGTWTINAVIYNFNMSEISIMH